MEESKDYTTIAGIGGWHRIGGQMYQLTPIGPAIKASANEYLKGLLEEDPVAEVKAELDGLPPEVAAILLERAMKKKNNVIDSEVGEQWSSSLDGVSFYLWQMLLTHQPATTHDWCREQLKNMSKTEAEKLVSKMGEVSGFDPNVRTRKAKAKQSS